MRQVWELNALINGALICFGDDIILLLVVEMSSKKVEEDDIFFIDFQLRLLNCLADGVEVGGGEEV